MGFKAFFEDIAQKKRRERLEANQAALQNQLIQSGFSPEEINNIVGTYVKTGDLQMPTQRPTGKYQLKPLQGGVSGPQEGIPEMAPIQLPRKRVFQQNRKTGDLEEAYNGPTGDEVQVSNFGDVGINRTTTEKNGVDIFYDPYTFEELSREPNGLSHNRRFPRKDKPKPGGRGGGGGSETPQQKAARAALNKYYDALKSGYSPDDMPEELLNGAASAAELLGLSLETVPSTKPAPEQSMWDKLRNKPPAPAPADKQVPRFTPNVKQPNVLTDTKNKTLSPEIAKQFLQQAGGDKEKARRMARQAGFKF